MFTENNSQEEIYDESIKELRRIIFSNELQREEVDINGMMEMCKLKGRETGLPVDIWIDYGRAFTKSGQERRLKFQGDKNE